MKLNTFQMESYLSADNIITFIFIYLISNLQKGLKNIRILYNMCINSRRDIINIKNHLSDILYQNDFIKLLKEINDYDYYFMHGTYIMIIIYDTIIIFL